MIFTQNPLLFLWVWKLLIVSFTSVYWRHDCGKNIIVTFLEYTECIFRGVQYAGCLVTWTIKFCMVVCNIFSTLFFFFSMKKGITSHGLNQVASDNIMVHRSFLGCGSSVQNVLDVICLVGPQYRTFLMSFVCYIEFGGGCKIFGKLLDPCTYYLIWMYVAGKVLYQISHDMYFIYIWHAEIVSDINIFFHTNKFLPSNQCPHQISLLGTSCS